MKQVLGSETRILSRLDVGSPHFFLAGRREIGLQARANYEQRLIAVAARDTEASRSAEAHHPTSPLHAPLAVNFKDERRIAPSISYEKMG
jgi:hypothetical protein